MPRSFGHEGQQPLLAAPVGIRALHLGTETETEADAVSETDTDTKAAAGGSVALAAASVKCRMRPCFVIPNKT